MSTQNAPDRFLERDAARLRWRIEGAGPGLVLLHGWALELGYWDEAAAALATGHTVLRFDRRGFGRSTGLPDIHRNVDDLAAMMDAAGLARAVLLGMSQGARLAIHFALRFPGRVRGLLLDGAPAFDAEPELPMDEYRRLLEREGLRALHAAILQHPLMRLYCTDPAARVRLGQLVAGYTGLDLLHAVPRATPPDLAAIRAPTLILNGALDSNSRREAGIGLCAAVAGAQRVELPSTGHLALLDDPAGYLATVQAFCARLPP
jgi:pimeloyl-ACP methyl ester carboxylesterase